MLTREECLSDLADFLLSVADELAERDALVTRGDEVDG